MPKHTALIIEDDEDIQSLLRFNLEKEGYEVSGALTGEDGLGMARKLHPDFLLLDLMLPGLDGLSVCRALKSDQQTKDIKIIMLTAKGEESDIIVGLELGADDYVAKPFSLKVLMARIRAVLRRNPREVDPGGEEIIIHDDLAIHPGRRQVLLAGHALELTATEFDLLSLLATRPGWVFTRSQIIDQVKGYDYAVTERAVDVQIVGLRRKLGAYGSRIETIRGVGYRFKD